MKVTKYFLILLSLLWTASTFAQSQNSNIQNQEAFDMRRNVRFTPESKEETVIVEIGEGIQQFSFNVDGQLTKGKLIVEIMNPKNVNQGKFKINTQLSSTYGEEVMARINKKIKNPEAGQWKVILKPTKAEGRVMIITESRK